MKKDYLNYDKIASKYNQRYPASQKWERGQALLNLAKKVKAKSILEVGSGTGFWLNLLDESDRKLFGIDYSMGMIEQSKNQPAFLNLTQGTATQLPLQSETFDLIYCVDAIHHFGNHRAFIQEAFRLLKPNGVLAVIGHDPHDESSSNWYIYNYFDTVYDTDLRRYPSAVSLLQMLRHEGFTEVSSQTVENIQNIHVGDAVLKDPFLKHDATSQLALLNEETYQDGIEKIKQALDTAKEKKENIVFKSEINVKMLVGYKR